MHLATRLWRTVASIQTGVVLLILVVILAAVGTIVLQRPATEPDEMQSAYSPQALRILGRGRVDRRISLLVVPRTDAAGQPLHRRGFHRSLPQFVALLLASIQISRRKLPPRFASAEIAAIADEESGLVAAERALHSLGFKPERVVREDHFGIFAERHRISELAVYIVHASLLLIFFGTIVDGIWGWRGTLNLNEGQTSNLVELRDGSKRTLPFAIRCDAAGQENYKDGSPKKWWSKLAVVKDGQEVQKKEIVVNDPLALQRRPLLPIELRSEWQGRQVDAWSQLRAKVLAEKQEIGLAVNDTVPLDADTTVRFAEFFPDFAVRDGQVYRKSNELENPAAHLVVTSKTSRERLRRVVPADG